MLTVLLGGVRSGKSTAALRLADRTGAPVCFVATSPLIDGDADLAARIAAHRADRPSSWTTLEIELDLAGAIHEAADALVIVDCLTVWLGNLMHHGRDDDAIDGATREAIDAATGRNSDTIVVTNEVGSGIVPADEMSRRYRDLLGRINQRWVSVSDEAHLVVAGRSLLLHEFENRQS